MKKRDMKKERYCEEHGFTYKGYCPGCLEDEWGDRRRAELKDEGI